MEGFGQGQLGRIGCGLGIGGPSFSVLDPDSLSLSCWCPLLSADGLWSLEMLLKSVSIF